MMQKFTGRQPKEAAYRGSNEKKETRKATVQKKKNYTQDEVSCAPCNKDASSFASAKTQILASLILLLYSNRTGVTVMCFYYG
jgi:hypothetical protein